MNPANNLTRDEARQRASLIAGPLVYHVALDLTRGDEIFGCETTIEFSCTEPGKGTFIDFLAHSVEKVELNGSPVPASAFDGARIHLPGLEGRNRLHIAATCEYQHVGAGLSHFRDPVDGQPYLHTQFETFDAHRMYPCFDQPDLKAVFHFKALAPQGWQVISNMRPTAEGVAVEAKNGAASWAFAPSPPMSTYITALVAGPFHAVRSRHREIDLGIHCRQSLARYLDPEEIFEITRQGFDFYERAFGYPYAFGKYDQVFVPEFSSGAMENAGCVTFHEGYIFRSRVTEAARERRAETILHEMAHMWFGDLVTMRWWDDLWLNESFATFMASLSQARATRFQNAWATFANQIKAGARRQDQLPSTHPIAANIPDIESVYLNFDAITYHKGASVLRQLVAWVSEEAFMRGLRGYFREREFANADLGEFLGALEAGSGRDLKAWSREWLEQAGLNTLRPSFEHDRGTLKGFAVLQEAPAEWPTLRSHRLAVGLYDAVDGKFERRRTVELDVVGARTEVPALDGERTPDLVLVNDGDLAYAKIRLDDRSLQTVTAKLAQLSDPLARALCWSAAWDMLRDALLPARAFLELVAKNVHGETDIGVLQTLLGQAAGAVDVYGDPAYAGRARQRLADLARGALERAPAGSDFQLAWARCFIAAARAPEDVRRVKGLLDGTHAYPGLVVDTELRWLIVRSLAAIGAIPDATIAAELERDPTDHGERYAASAHAARPTKEAKAAAWHTIRHDTAPPLAKLSAIMGGFGHSEQRELLEPYTPQYFAALELVWEERDIEVALAFLRQMYPRTVIGEDVLRMTSETLERKTLHGPIRRILLEERDLMQRALQARKLDAAAGAKTGR
jgi:aminopeptidase N